MSDEFLRILGLSEGPNDLLGMREMLSMVEELRNACNGWHKCIVSLLNGEITDDKMRFLCLQTVEHYLKNFYAKAPISEQNIIRQFLLRWIQMFCVNPQISPATYVKNKAAQLFSLAFINDYPQRWPAFFDDMINTVNLGPQAAEHFLRVLKAINSEISDKCLPYSAAENSRNKDIKKEMREKNVGSIVSSLYTVLNSYKNSHSEITSMCFETLAMYVHWIDVGLIVNNDFMNTLARLLPIPSLCESVIVCIESIVRKKMEHVDKCKLIEFLMSMLRDVGVLSQLSAFDIRFVGKLSQLVNSMGVALLDSYTKLKKNGSEVEQLQCFEVVIEDKVPILLQFLSHDSNIVSKAVIDSLKNYVHFLKSRESVLEQQTENLRLLMVTVIHKMRCAKPYDYDCTSQDFEEFQEFRRGLKIILDGIICLNKELVLNYMLELTGQKLKDWSTSSFSDVEVILTVILFIGEISSINNRNLLEKRKNLESLIISILNSNIVSFPHPVIQVLFFEIMVRFEELLLFDPHKILSVINIFLGNHGLRHSEAKVRSRVACLFCKFIKASCSVLQNSAKQIMNLFQETLVAVGFQTYEKNEWLCVEDQLYIFEAVSILLFTSLLSDQEKTQALQGLMHPNISEFKNTYQELEKETVASKRELLSDRLGHCIAVATRLSKGIIQNMTMEKIGCECVFIQCLEVFLNTLNINDQSTYLRNCLRQYIKRMIANINKDILPYISQTSMRLLQGKDIQNVQDCLQFLVQVIHKFRYEALPLLCKIFPPLMSTVFDCLREQIDDSDFNMRKEQDYLKKLYFQYITAVVISVPDAFYVQDATMKKEILISVAQTVLESPDPLTQKECFMIFKNLIASSTGRDAGDTTIHSIYQTIIDVCFQVLQKSKEPDSYHATLMVSQESAICLKAIHNKIGDEMTRYIQTTYLSNPPVSPQCKEQFARAINTDVKTLLIFLRSNWSINDAST